MCKKKANKIDYRSLYISLFISDRIQVQKYQTCWIHLILKAIDFQYKQLSCLQSNMNQVVKKVVSFQKKIES